MTPQQTRHILRTHRNDGRYAASDPLFAEALSEASRSPELAAWLAREHALDDVIGRKVEEVQPPPGLRETILLGARASQLKRRRWLQGLGLAVAAAIVIALLVASLLRVDPKPEGGALALENLVQLAIADFTSARFHSHVYEAPLAAVQNALSTRTTRFGEQAPPTPEMLRAANCAVVDLNGYPSYEVCFQREGVWYHLYVTQLDRAIANPTPATTPVILEQGGLAAASWSEGAVVYTVLTPGEVEALRRVI